MDGQPSHYSAVADAFSRKATVYDAFGENHPNLDRMRQRVYDHISSVQQAGAHLLELNAGTGTDALALIKRGFRIHATDLAPGMLAEIKSKIETHHLQDGLSAQACSFTELDKVTAGPFDGVISNFGGLNCIDELRLVTRHLPTLLKPGGVVTWVIMPPICPWELAVFWKDWQVATRRLRPGGVSAHVEGVHFKTDYFSAAQTIESFGSRFDLLRLEGLSIVTPPADNVSFAVKRPTLYKNLVRLESAIAQRWPFNRIGDFFILSMRFCG